MNGTLVRTEARSKEMMSRCSPRSRRPSSTRTVSSSTYPCGVTGWLRVLVGPEWPFRLPLGSGHGFGVLFRLGQDLEVGEPSPSLFRFVLVEQVGQHGGQRGATAALIG